MRKGDIVVDVGDEAIIRERTMERHFRIISSEFAKSASAISRKSLRYSTSVEREHDGEERWSTATRICSPLTVGVLFSSSAKLIELTKVEMRRRESS